MPTAEDVRINLYLRTAQMTTYTPVERLVSSMRGRIILGTALHLAIKELEKVEGTMRQYSTLEDMRSMLDSDIFINIHDDDEE
jgi:hypothetical protein